MIQAPRVTLQILASLTVVIYDCNMFIALGHCCFLYFFDKNSDLKTFFPPKQSTGERHDDSPKEMATGSDLHPENLTDDLVSTPQTSFLPR